MNEDEVECQICHQKLGALGRHVATHGIGVFEYQRMFPGAPTISVDAGRKISESLMGNTRAMGHTTSEETRQKISQALTEHTVSEETKREISRSLMGHAVSEETKRLISEANARRNEEVPRRISQSLIGHEFSEKTRKAISESLARNAEEMSEETKREISEANTGRTMSEEAIKQMSEARKKLWTALDWWKKSGLRQRKWQKASY